MEFTHLTEVLVIGSNLAVAIVTGLLILQTVKEGHRHEEKDADRSERSEERLVDIVHEVLRQEHSDEEAPPPAVEAPGRDIVGEKLKRDREAAALIDHGKVEPDPLHIRESLRSLGDNGKFPA